VRFTSQKTVGRNTGRARAVGAAGELGANGATRARVFARAGRDIYEVRRTSPALARRTEASFGSPTTLDRGAVRPVRRPAPGEVVLTRDAARSWAAKNRGRREITGLMNVQNSGRRSRSSAPQENRPVLGPVKPCPNIRETSWKCRRNRTETNRPARRRAAPADRVRRRRSDATRRGSSRRRGEMAAVVSSLGRRARPEAVPAAAP
jgi:hypothetical protein